MTELKNVSTIPLPGPDGVPFECTVVEDFSHPVEHQRCTVKPRRMVALPDWLVLLEGPFVTSRGLWHAGGRIICDKHLEQLDKYLLTH